MFELTRLGHRSSKKRLMMMRCDAKDATPKQNESKTLH